MPSCMSRMSLPLAASASPASSPTAWTSDLCMVDLRCNSSLIVLHRIPRAGPEDALRAGRRRLLDGGRIDMSALAEAVGVNRVTLYRWFGSRDHFLVEVLWSLASAALREIDEATVEEGPARVVAVAVGLLRAVIENPAMQRWFGEEGEHAMRLLTRHEPGFQPRLIEFFEGVLAREQEAGRLSLPIDLHELAYVVVRLIESYVYLDLITGEQPDPRRAEATLRLLLRAD